MKKLLLFLILVPCLAFGQFTKKSITNQINNKIRIPGLTASRVSSVLDSMNASYALLGGGGGGGGYTTIQNNGSSLTQRSNANFFNGFTLADNSGSTRTDISLGGNFIKNTAFNGAFDLTFGATTPLTAFNVSAPILFLPVTGSNKFQVQSPGWVSSSYPGYIATFSENAGAAAQMEFNVTGSTSPLTQAKVNISTGNTSAQVDITGTGSGVSNTLSVSGSVFSLNSNSIPVFVVDPVNLITNIGDASSSASSMSEVHLGISNSGNVTVTNTLGSNLFILDNTGLQLNGNFQTNGSVTANSGLFSQITDVSNTYQGKLSLLSGSGSSATAFKIWGTTLPSTNRDFLTVTYGGTVALPQLSGGSGKYVAIDASGNLSVGTPAGGGISGLTTNQVMFATSSTTIGGSTSFIWDNTNKALSVGASASIGRLFTRADGSTFYGFNAGTFASLGSADGFNTGFGLGAGFSLTTTANFYESSYNSLFGYGAGLSLTTGSQATFMGYKSGYNMTTGGNNTAYGANTLVLTTTGHDLDAFGLNVLRKANGTAYQNGGFGSNALIECTSCHHNYAFGFNALGQITVGYGNSAFGSEALEDNKVGVGNSAFGYYAGLYNHANSNVYVGYQSGNFFPAIDSAGSANTYVGTNTGPSRTTTIASPINLAIGLGYQANPSYSYSGLLGSADSLYRVKWGIGGEEYADLVGSGLYIKHAITAPSTGTIQKGVLLYTSNHHLWARIQTTNYQLDRQSGITNTAANNEIGLSDGTNIVPSGFFKVGTGSYQTTGSGTLTLAPASASNVSFVMSSGVVSLGLTASPQLQIGTSSSSFGYGGSGGSLTLSSGGGVSLSSSIGSYTQMILVDNATNTLVTLNRITRISSTNTTSGYGLREEKTLSNSTQTSVISSTFDHILTTTTNTAEVSKTVLSVLNAGSLVTSFVAEGPNFAFLTTGASYGGGVKTIHIPRATTAPSTNVPSGGVLYVNNTNDHLSYWTGTTSYDLLSGGSGITALTGQVTASGTGSVVATIQSSVALSGSPTTTTQSANDNSTKIATTAYVDRLALTPATDSNDGYLTMGDHATGSMIMLSNATDAAFTMSVNSVKYLPAATLSVSRAITIPTGNNGDRMEIYNNEAGFAWTLTGASVYLADGTTTVTTLLANTNYLIRKVGGLWRILN